MTNQEIYTSVKKFLQSSSNQSLIASGNFSELYCQARQDFDFANELCQLSELLIESGIDVLSFITSIPADFLWGSIEPYVINFPTDLQEIGAYAFQNTSQLRFSKLPSKIRKIERGAFSNCKGLTSLSLPGSIEYLGVSVFSSCSNLTEVTIEEGISFLSDSAFAGCVNLTSIYLPSTIEELENFAIQGCPRLTIHYAGTKRDWAKIKKGIAVVDDRASIKCSDGVWGVHN